MYSPECSSVRARAQLGMLRGCALNWSPVGLAAGYNLLQVHDVGVAALLQHPDLSHGCDWNACENILQVQGYFFEQMLKQGRIIVVD